MIPFSKVKTFYDNQKLIINLLICINITAYLDVMIKVPLRFILLLDECTIN